MANVATASTIPLITQSEGDLYATKIVCVMDTVGDFTLLAADANHHIAVLGLELSAIGDCTVSIKSGTTKQVEYSLLTGSGLSKSVDGSIKFITAKNEALVLNSDVALGTFVVYVQKIKKIQF